MATGRRLLSSYSHATRNAQALGERAAYILPQRIGTQRGPNRLVRRSSTRDGPPALDCAYILFVPASVLWSGTSLMLSRSKGATHCARLRISPVSRVFSYGRTSLTACISDAAARDLQEDAWTYSDYDGGLGLIGRSSSLSAYLSSEWLGANSGPVAHLYNVEIPAPPASS